MPSDSNDLGETLARLMKRAGLSNPDVAAVTHVDHTTVSKWRSGKQRPDDAKLKLIVGLLASRGVRISMDELRGESNGNGPSMVRERTRPLMYFAGGEIEFTTATAQQRARAWLEQFLLELAEEGASQDFLDASRRLLLNPSNYSHGFGAAAGQPDEMNDDEKFRHMKALATGVRAALKDRQKKGQGR